MFSFKKNNYQSNTGKHDSAAKKSNITITNATNEQMYVWCNRHNIHQYKLNSSHIATSAKQLHMIIELKHKNIS